MASQTSPVLKQWARIVQRWPVDKVRPENVSFQKIMQQRVTKLSNPAVAAQSTAKSNEALVLPAEPPKNNEQNEIRQINVLNSFLEDSYSTQFPLPASLRTPASSPSHYDDLLKELEQAPGRSWFGGVMQRISGSLRFS